VTTVRREADAAVRLEVLMAVAAAADATQPLDVMPRLLDELVPAVADLCTVEDAEGRPVAVRYAGPDAGEVEAALLARAPTAADVPFGGPHVLAGGRAVLLRSLDDAVHRAAANDDAELALFRRLDFRSMIVAPLRAHGAPLGNVVLAVGPGRAPYDDTDLRFAEAVALQLARALDAARTAAMTRELHALVDNMDDAVNVRDLEGRIVLANAASAAMLGARDPGELPDTPLLALWERFSLFDADGRPLRDVDLPWYRLLHGEPHVEPLLMRRVTRETGEQQWLLNKATPIRDPAGRTVLVMSISEDVTAAHRAELGRRLLVEAGRLLSGSLEVEAVLQEVAELAVPTLADWCGIDLPGSSGVLEAVAVAHLEPERAAKGRELRRRYPVTVDGPSGVAEVLRTGTPLRVDGITDETLQAEAVDATHLELLRELGLTSILGVPLRAGDEIVGVLLLGATQQHRRLDDHDLELADALARRIGEALRNARLYRERDAIAHLLSAGLAPEQAPEVAGCEVAVRYRPAGDGIEAGGDFYEVVDTPAGVIVLIGDVAGKGAAAAALSAVCRVTLRTAARLTGDPRAALDELNHVLRRRRTLSLCTVAALALPPELPGASTLLLAGHPPPLLVRDGGVEAVGRSGPLLGAVEAADWPPQRLHLHPGDSLVLFTDGVLDAALPDGQRFGEARLEALVGAAGADPEALVAGLDDALAGLRLRDDVALLAIRCPGVVPLLARNTLDGDVERLVALESPGGPQAPAAARDALRAALEGRVRGVLESDALLIVSELVTNAVRHGGARTRDETLELHVALVGEAVRLEVVDPGEGFEPGAHGPRHDGGYGLHLLDRLAARWGVAGSAPTTVWTELR
jgi:serine phosphatase RsbU (regulator of sigma subunit)/PAS domain-containing protein/anti-sigma regulatory factor (Ser/Thr protein kinase)